MIGHAILFQHQIWIGFSFMSDRQTPAHMIQHFLTFVDCNLHIYLIISIEFAVLYKIYIFLKSNLCRQQIKCLHY